MSKIIVNQEILAGKPIIEGTRISVEFVVELLSSGMTIEEILKEYPHLKRRYFRSFEICSSNFTE